MGLGADSRGGFLKEPFGLLRGEGEGGERGGREREREREKKRKK